MFHILINNKKFILSIKLFIFFLLVSIFFRTIIIYKGNWLIYFLFSAVSNYLIWFAFRKNFSFFEIFFSIFLWLGFWFKFTIILSLSDGVFREGVGRFNYSAEQFDLVLIVSSIAITGVVVAGYIRNFFFSYPNINFEKISPSLFYQKYRNIILCVFFFIIVLVSCVNFYLKIYQKGIVSLENYNFLFSGFIKMLLLFGLTSISSFILYFEIATFKKLSNLTLIIVLLETFFSSLSMISRAMFFSCLPIYFSIYKFTRSIKKNFDISYFIKFFIIVICLFYISVVSVNFIRTKYFYIGLPLFKSEEFNKNKELYFIEEDNSGNFIYVEKKIITISSSFNEFLYLSVNRWVGIDAVMAVVGSSEILNFNLLKRSFLDRFQLDSLHFYERTFGLEKPNSINLIKNIVKGNTLPGIIAFLYYSGSLIFIFLIIIGLCLLASLIEFLSFLASKQNMIFSSIISMVIAYRFTHFGYLPNQSYLLFGSMFFTILFVFCFFRLLKKSKD
jgi:hypothetical protein